MWRYACGSNWEIGYFRFTGESSVAAGIRRIEAVCGKAADYLLREEKKLIRNIKGVIGNQEDPVESIRRLIDDKKAVEKELHKIQMASSSNKLDEILAKSTIIEGISVSKEIHGADMHALKQLGYDALQKRGKNTVVVLGSRLIEDGKVFVMVAITDDVIQTKNLKAGALVAN